MIQQITISDYNESKRREAAMKAKVGELMQLIATFQSELDTLGSRIEEERFIQANYRVQRGTVTIPPVRLVLV